MNKNSIIVVVLAIVLIAAGFYFFGVDKNKTNLPDNNGGQVACTMEAKICPDGTAVGRHGPNCDFDPCPVVQAPDSHSDLIKVSSPLANASVGSPLKVTGTARGTWYFEASFPVKLLDSNGKELAAVPAQAKGDWMTTDFVPFEATLTFAKPTTSTGTLVLHKDNPSGDPAKDDSISIPVTFAQ